MEYKNDIKNVCKFAEQGYCSLLVLFLRKSRKRGYKEKFRKIAAVYHRAPVLQKRHRNIPVAVPLCNYVILSFVMSSMLNIASNANRIPNLNSSMNDVISFLSPISDAQYLNFSKVSYCTCVSVCTSLSSFRVSKFSMCEYVPLLMMSRFDGLMFRSIVLL